MFSLTSVFFIQLFLVWSIVLFFRKEQRMRNFLLKDICLNAIHSPAEVVSQQQLVTTQSETQTSDTVLSTVEKQDIFKYYTWVSASIYNLKILLGLFNCEEKFKYCIVYLWSYIRVSALFVCGVVNEKVLEE